MCSLFSVCSANEIGYCSRILSTTIHPSREEPADESCCSLRNETALRACVLGQSRVLF